MDRNSRSALVLAGFIGFAGVSHFANPEFFDPIVPDWMPGEVRTITHVSGAVEIAGAVMVANPRTRKFGALFCLLTFIGVFPANIQSALDGGIDGAPPPLDSAAAAWARLPLQLPLIVWAWRISQRS